MSVVDAIVNEMTPSSPPTRLEDLSPEDIASLRERAKKDLFFFAKGILGFDWLIPRIHLPICMQLEDPSNTRFRLLLPRGWLKTTICSCAYPIWRVINNPNVRILIVLNTFTNACAKLSKIDSIFKSNALFRLLFPEVLPDKSCTWKTDRMVVKRSIAADEGTFEAAGTRTQVTSRHYDLIIEDDTVAPELDDLNVQNLCPRKEDVEQAIGWHRLALPLLVDPKSSQILVVGTRWFQQDIHSWIEDNEKNYRSYTRACREVNGRPDLNGEPTYPERFDKDTLDSLKTALGPYMFSCLYMNTPMSPDLMVFHQDWMTYYQTEPKQLIVYTSVDPAGDPEYNKGESDYNVVLTTGKDLATGRVYVLDYFYEQCNPGKVVDAIFDHVRKWRPLTVLIEKEGYQQSLAYWIKERMQKDELFFNVELIITGNKHKNVRVQGLQPLFFARKILLRSWMTSLVNTLLAFPYGGEHSLDLADCLAAQMPFWALTPAERTNEEVVSKEHPLSFDNAIDEIKHRRTTERALVMDMMEPSDNWSPIVFM